MKELSIELRKALLDGLAEKYKYYKNNYNRRHISNLLKKELKDLYSKKVFTKIKKSECSDQKCDGFCGGELSKTHIVLRDGRKLCMTCSWHVIAFCSLIEHPIPPITFSEPSHYKEYLEWELRPNDILTSIKRYFFGISDNEKKQAKLRAQIKYETDLQDYQEREKEYEKYLKSKKLLIWNEWVKYQRDINVFWPGYPPDWHYRVGWVLDKYGRKCIKCGSTEGLQIHHKILVSKKEGTNDINNLIPLCRICHEYIHFGFIYKKSHY